MSEQPETEETEKRKNPQSIPSQLKRIGIALVIFFIFTSLAGQNFSGLSSPAKKPAVKEAPEKPSKATVSPTPIESAAPETAAPAPEPVVPVVVQQHDDERLKALEEKIEQLEAAHRNEISELKEKMNSQNQQVQDKANATLASLVVFEQLKDAVNNGKPYDMQLSQLKKFALDNSQAEDFITPLEIHSSSGITTPAQLKEKFTPLVKQALTNNNESAWLKFVHRFITIRKIGNLPGNDDEAILARAENMLERNDLSAAISELNQLSEPAKEIFKNWEADAQYFLDTQSNLNKLQLMLTKTESTGTP